MRACPCLSTSRATWGEQIAVAIQSEIDDRIEQRMAGADEGGERLTLRRHQLLFKGDPLVA